MEAGDIALRVHARRELALRDRVVAAVRHVLFARPDELHRRAGHFLGDDHGLAHPVVDGAAATEAAAEQQLVHLALRERQARCLGGRGQRRFAVLGRRPHFAPLRRVARRRGHRLHRRVVLVRIGVHGFDLARRGGDRRARIAGRVADGSFLRVETFLHHRRERRARRGGVRPEVPFDRRRVEGGLRVPPGVGDHGHGRIAHAHDLLHAGPLHHGRGVDALHLAAEHRAILDRRVEHARQLEVMAVDLGAGHLVDGVEARQALAGDLPVLRILERHVRRRLSASRRPPPPCRTWSCVRSDRA